MYEAQRKDFNGWIIKGEYQKIENFDIIICEQTNLKYHIDIDTLVEV